MAATFCRPSAKQTEPNTANVLDLILSIFFPVSEFEFRLLVYLIEIESQCQKLFCHFVIVFCLSIAKIRRSCDRLYRYSRLAESRRTYFQNEKMLAPMHVLLCHRPVL